MRTRFGAELPAPPAVVVELVCPSLHPDRGRPNREKNGCSPAGIHYRLGLELKLSLSIEQVALAYASRLCEDHSARDRDWLVHTEARDTVLPRIAALDR
jgi:hypothetical protein